MSSYSWFYRSSIFTLPLHFSTPKLSSSMSSCTFIFVSSWYILLSLLVQYLPLSSLTQIPPIISFLSRFPIAFHNKHPLLNSSSLITFVSIVAQSFTAPPYSPCLSLKVYAVIMIMTLNKPKVLI